MRTCCFDIGVFLVTSDDVVNCLGAFLFGFETNFLLHMGVEFTISDAFHLNLGFIVFQCL